MYHCDLSLSLPLSLSPSPTCSRGLTEKLPAVGFMQVMY